MLQRDEQHESYAFPDGADPNSTKTASIDRSANTIPPQKIVRAYHFPKSPESSFQSTYFTAASLQYLSCISVSLQKRLPFEISSPLFLTHAVIYSPFSIVHSPHVWGPTRNDPTVFYVHTRGTDHDGPTEPHQNTQRKKTSTHVLEQTRDRTGHIEPSMARRIGNRESRANFAKENTSNKAHPHQGGTKKKRAHIIFVPLSVDLLNTERRSLQAAS